MNVDTGQLTIIVCSRSNSLSFLLLCLHWHSDISQLNVNEKQQRILGGIGVNVITPSPNNTGLFFSLENQ